jgi:hypothetical protein
VDRLAALLVALGPLAVADPAAPAVHVALAGVLALAREPLEEMDRLWGSTESPAHTRWQRDRPLLTVAGKAREQRLLKAWEALRGGGQRPSGPR